MKTGDKMENCKWIYWWGQSSSWFCSHFLFSIFRAHFPLSIPLSPFPVSRSPLPTPYFSNICRATLDSNPHSSFKLPVNSKKHKNHQNVMSTKKFQFVVVSLFTCLYNRKKKLILQYKQGLSNRFNLTCKWQL